MTDSGFRNERLQYDVAYRDDGPRLLPSDWRLDNFYKSGSGVQKLKTAKEYMTLLELDLDGDGEVEHKEEAPAFDLRFEHLHSNGVIWIRALVVNEYEQNKDLRLLVADIVSSIAGGYEFRTTGRHITGGDVRLAARGITEGPAKLAGLDAFSTVVDVTNVDQSLISAPAVMRRVKIVLIRSGLVYKPGTGAGQLPVYLYAYYSEHPTQFDAHLPAFMQLLGQVRIANRAGYEESLAPVSSGVEGQSPQLSTRPAPPSDAPVATPDL
jgi:hypothetical protein